MSLLAVIGDVLWILALAVMAGGSRLALRRTDPGVQAPLFGRETHRWVAFCAVPAAALAASLWLVYAARMPALGGDLALMVFGVRASAAALFALLQLRTLNAAFRTLAARGQLKP